MTVAGKRTLVLGGGMAGLTAARQLADAGRHVTLVQRGWRLGGKAASHRGVNGRIEEHGLHVWLGYYDNAFRLIQETYAELDRPVNAPDCPIRTWQEAFAPSNHVGVFNNDDGVWSPWVARFSPDTRTPGGDGAQQSPAQLVRRAAALLADLIGSMSPPAEPGGEAPTGVVLSASPDWRPRGASTAPADQLRTLGQLMRRAELGGMVGMVQVLNLLSRVPDTIGPIDISALSQVQLQSLRGELRARIVRSADTRRLWEVVDLVTTSTLGIYTDRLLDPDRGFAAVNHLDFREWLALHGADPATLDSGLVRGMYDLVFAYRDGEHDRPAFEAGTGLALASRFFFDYKGALFWKMQAGMGETVIAPMYQALRARNVQFRFFHRLVGLRLDAAGRSVEEVDLACQAQLAPGVAQYHPLVDVDGLPCFPDHPVLDQLVEDQLPPDLESHFGSRGTERPVTLRRGEHFDDVVLAVSLGMIPQTCTEIVDGDRRWRAMVENVATVATQSLQVWTSPTDADLGWEHTGSTTAGYKSPFDTYSSMPHLLDHESWGVDGPAGVGYFCAALPEREADPERAHAAVRSHASAFLEADGPVLWPRSRDADGGFDWGVLHSGDHCDQRALDEQYWVANVDPSDRYVQSLPGSSRFRLAADESGLDNLYLAGDWTDTGLNAGCIEAAVISGIQAANAALDQPVGQQILGGWTPTRADPQTAESRTAG